MITYSVVQKSKLEGALRLDAEYYCVSSDLKCEFLLGNDTAEFIQYGTSEELNEENRGFPVLRLNEYEDCFIGEPAKYCNKINKQVFESLKLKRGDVLVCRTNGNPDLVGKAAIVMEDIDVAFASYLFRVRPIKKHINSACLTVYLNSKHGRRQIEKYLMPSIQSNFSPAKFREIKIPIFPIDFQNEIDDLMKQAYSLKNESQNLYAQADALFLEELELKEFEAKDDLSYVVNLSNIKSAHRIDAEYFQPKCHKLLTRIEKKNVKLLPDIIESVPARFNPRAHPDKYFQYVELSNIDSSIGIIYGYSEVLGKEAPSRAKRVLRAGDVIISSVEGSFEKVALVDKERTDYLASTGFFQFRSENILPEVLLILAKSIVLQVQLKKEVSGTILTAVPKEAIKNILIPIIPEATQQKIAEFVSQSHEARKKAKHLLEQAKQKVESFIEGA